MNLLIFLLMLAFPVLSRAEQAAGAAAPAVRGRLKADTAALRYADGARFAWRGLTAFRLVELIAHRRAADADRYLAWAARNGVTIVRVLTMTKHMFGLTPEDGRAALPRLLGAAHRHGLYVEVVALADTGAHDASTFDLAAHVRAVGEIAAQHENAIVEIANEPDHPTQRMELADPKRLLALARLVPETVPVALGSGDDPIYAASTLRPNTYLTAHFSRDDGARGWAPHLSIREGLRLQSAHRRFVVDDEPIGAAADSKPGTRDADPARWFGRGLLARVLRIGSTFHSDSGLHAKVPTGVELACFEAWRRGMLYFPAAIDERRSESGDGPVAAYERTHAADVLTIVDGDSAWAVALGVTEDPRIQLQPGWRATRTDKHDRVWIVHLER